MFRGKSATNGEGQTDGAPFTRGLKSRAVRTEKVTAFGQTRERQQAYDSKGDGQRHHIETVEEVV